MGGFPSSTRNHCEERRNIRQLHYRYDDRSNNSNDERDDTEDVDGAGPYDYRTNFLRALQQSRERQNHQQAQDWLHMFQLERARLALQTQSSIVLEEDAAQLLKISIPRICERGCTSPSWKKNGSIQKQKQLSVHHSSSIAKTKAKGAPCCTTSHDITIGSTDEGCLICFGAYRRSDHVISLSCGHSYHKSCVQEWFYRQCVCPYCRFDVEEDYLKKKHSKSFRIRNDTTTRPFWGQSQIQKQRQKSRPHLVDVLRQRQNALRHERHRQTVLHELSFTSPPPPTIHQVSGMMSCPA